MSFMVCDIRCCQLSLSLDVTPVIDWAQTTRSYIVALCRALYQSFRTACPWVWCYKGCRLVPETNHQDGITKSYMLECTTNQTDQFLFNLNTSIFRFYHPIFSYYRGGGGRRGDFFVVYFPCFRDHDTGMKSRDERETNRRTMYFYKQERTS